MAEAMLNGTVCIATNWSSNTEFMNNDVACMVDYSFITLEKDMSPYRKGAKWADANTDEAAEYMKRLLNDKNYYDSLSKKAKEFVETKLSMDNISELYIKRIHEITAENRG
jgi:glycosyltransferase involved in cell wall biosynthesis